jgi:hypothetical protein
MIRLYLYVEGQTEQQYAQTVLREHLANHSVFVAGAILAATGRRHGIIHRGGGRHFLAHAKRSRTASTAASPARCPLYDHVRPLRSLPRFSRSQGSR